MSKTENFSIIITIHPSPGGLFIVQKSICKSLILKHLCHRIYSRISLLQWMESPRIRHVHEEGHRLG